MNNTPETSTETFILAGKNPDGPWQKIESATREEGETADDVNAFLQTMAQASTRNFLELEIMSEAEFLRRSSPPPMIAA